MIERNLERICFSSEFGHQMRFVSGPRQCGKTTLIKMFLSEKFDTHYFNWDFRAVREQYQKGADWFLAEVIAQLKREKKLWVAFDEIHKYPKWKNILKEFYDKYHEQLRFIVTGSARLDFFRRSGDSLAGRYFLFRLFPLTLNEITKKNKPYLDSLNSADQFVSKRISTKKTKSDKQALDQLLQFSGFPDPFLAGREKYHLKWREGYLDKILREDVVMLAHVKEIENIMILMQLMKDRAAAPLSVNSLMRDMSVSYQAVRNYLRILDMMYMVFYVAPYSQSISRGIRKEKKFYFYDWTYVDDLDKRFENYVAAELFVLISYWNDNGGQFELRYVRTKEGKESDFLILNSGKPWLLFEVKMSAQTIARHHYSHAQLLGGIPFVQIVAEPGVLKKRDCFYQISAERFF